MPYQISSAGDLEVAVLREAHSLLASAMHADLYKVHGELGRQIALFHTPACLDLFLIYADDFFSEARDNVYVTGASRNLSLLEGTAWLQQRLPAGKPRDDLGVALGDLRSWLQTADPIKFWCGSLERMVGFKAERRRIVNIGANSRKHNVFRLNKVTEQLEGLCRRGGFFLSDSEIFFVLESLLENLDGYFQYHASRLAELLGGVFLALNADVARRFEENGRTNDSRHIAHVPGVSSDYFRDLYTSTLVFQNYSVARIVDLSPRTSVDYQQTYDFGSGTTIP